MIAAIHLNAPPETSPAGTACTLTLNDHVPSHRRNDTLWREVKEVQRRGVKVMGLLGGAAKGTYKILDVRDAERHNDGKVDADFERHYAVLKSFVHERKLDGLDLDVEEEMSLQGILRLIDRLHSDFDHTRPEGFVITLAPVAAALLYPHVPQANLSGFSYEDLEVLRGPASAKPSIEWYNAQFYCGWGDMHTTLMYDAIVARGWSPERFTVGLVTSPENGVGFVERGVLGLNLVWLRRRYETFGGVMGWEYFNSSPGGREEPWRWAEWMTGVLGRGSAAVMLEHGKGVAGQKVVQGKEAQKGKEGAVDAEDTREADVVPDVFEYFTDGSVDDS
jgi:hypothetical protein